MRKFIVVSFIFFFSMIVVDAECEYKELRELNTLASYIQSNYEYNESTRKFDITITNLTDKFYIFYEGNRYDPSSGTVIISGVEEGTRVSAEVIVSIASECFNEKPRMIYVNIPYINHYYKSNLCNGHTSLNVCNSRFLDYNLSESTFIKLIEQDKIDQDNNKKPSENKPYQEKPGFIEKTVEVVKDYSIPLIVVIVVSGITISIYSVVIRKIKHGL